MHPSGCTPLLRSLADIDCSPSSSLAAPRRPVGLAPVMAPDLCLIRDAGLPGRRRTTAYERPGLPCGVRLSADAVLVRRRRSSLTADLRVTSRKQGVQGVATSTDPSPPTCGWFHWSTSP
jgi:hypothetical protein